MSIVKDSAALGGGVLKSIIGVAALVGLAVSAARAETIVISGATAQSGPYTPLASGPSFPGPVFSGNFNGLTVTSLSGADPIPADIVLGGALQTVVNSPPSLGTTYFFVSEAGLTSPTATTTLNSYITESFVPVGWSVTQTIWTGSGINDLGTTLQTLTTGPGSGPKTLAANNLISTPGAFSLTHEYAITYLGGGPAAINLLSTEKNRAALIPELPTWAALAVGFLSLAYAGARGRRIGHPEIA